MKLSIIVPVYNTEKYIVRCVSSLLRQNYNDYEIIIVNDGTPDCSMKVLEKEIHSDKIIVVNQMNGGQSLARNEGMKLASGDYIWFVDSDDWVTTYCLKAICDRLDGCDILYFNQYYESSDSSDLPVIKNNEDTIGRELSKKDVMVGPPFYIFRRQFLIDNNISFTVGIFHEDNLYTPVALYSACEVKPYNVPVYHKYANQHSTTRTINPKRCYDLMVVAEKLSIFAKEKVSEIDRWAWGHFIADTMNGALLLSRKCNSRVRTDLEDFVSSHPELLEYLCHSAKLPTRIMGRLAKNLHLPLVSLYQFLSFFRYAH